MLYAAKTDPVGSDVTKEYRLSSSVASGPRRIELNIVSPQLTQFQVYVVLEKNLQS
jgi:hypothetical protein